MRVFGRGQFKGAVLFIWRKITPSFLRPVESGGNDAYAYIMYGLVARATARETESEKVLA